MVKSQAKKIRSLTVTLAIAFLALSAVVLLIAGGLNMYFSFQNQRKIISGQQDFIAEKAAGSVRNFIKEKFSILGVAVSIDDLIAASPKRQKLVLEKMLGIEPSFRQLALLDAGDRPLLAVSRLSSFGTGRFLKCDRSKQYSEVSRTKTHIGSIYIDEVTGEPLLAMAVPITDVFGDFEGSLMAEVNLKFMWDLVGNMRIGKKGVAYVVNRAGGLIAFGDISRVLAGENLSRLEDVARFKESNGAQGSRGANLSRGIRGGLVVSTHVALGTPDWAVVVELPVHEAYETVIGTLALSGLSMFLGFILAIVAAVNLSRRITKPIIKLRDAVKNVSRGRLDTEIAVASKDEIGELAASFNQMIMDLNRTTVSRDSLMEEVAERKKVEEELRKAEEKYRTQFEGALDAIFVADSQTGILIDCNPAATRLVGREKSEIIGKHQRILHLPETIEGKFSKTFKEHLKEKRGQTLETQIITKKGKVKEVAIKANLLESGGKSIIQGIFRDITEHKKAEREREKLLCKVEEANNNKTQFVSNVSHELRTPMASIKGFISTIRSDKDMDPAERDDFLRIIEEETDRLSRIIDGLLDLSRIESGRIQLKKVKVKLTDIAQKGLESVRHQAAQKNLGLKNDLPKECPYVLVDKDKMLQVIINLLSNAVKYTKEGQIAITARQDSGDVVLEVSDTGIGIAKKDLPRVFEKFQRFETPGIEAVGSGLGLSIVKALVELHEGRMMVESEPGKGSKFGFRLPIFAAN